MLEFLKKLYRRPSAKVAPESQQLAVDGQHQAEEGLRQSEEHFSQLVAGVRDYAVFLLDPTGYILTWNSGAEYIKGYAAPEIIGQHFTRFYPPDAVARGWPAEELRLAAATGRFEDEGWRIRKDGTRFWANVVITALRDETGQIRGYLKITRDLTERQQAEENARRLARAEAARQAAEASAEVVRRSEERFRLLAAAANDGFWDIDLTTGAVWCNDAYDRLFGPRPADTSTSLDWWRERLHPDDRERVVGSLEAALAGTTERWSAEYRLRRADGSYAYVLDRGLISRDATGRTIRAAGSMLDLTERKRTEEALHRERELLQTIIDKIPVMITVYEPDTRVLRLNREFERVVGWSVAPATSVSLMEACYPDPEYRARVAQFMASGQDGWMDIRMRTRDGRDVETSWANVRLSDQTQVGIGIDITQRKQVEEALRLSEARFRLALRTGAVIAFEQDLELRYVWLYPQDPTFPAHNLGRTDAELLPGPEGEALMALKREVLRTGQRLRQTVLVTLPGEVRYYDLDMEPRHDPAGQLIGVGGAALDVTALKRVEQALREADRRKDEFLATMAHELRNPLAPVRTAVQVLKAKGPADPDLIWAREVIDRQVGQMARLLDDLLDVARITRNKLELRKERVDLATIVASAVETSRPHITAGGHELSLHLPPQPLYLDADPVRLAQVLANLLNNAAKYTERGGHIWLTATVADATEQTPAATSPQVVVRVRDNGIGIAAPMLPQLFRMFAQATPALERAQGGLGIGLALVKGLVEMHGGTVDVRSDGPGLGSEFLVRLPLAAPALAVEAPPITAPALPADSGRKILVADDNRDAADSLAMVLRLQGYEVHTVTDGQEAVNAALTLRPDVVLLDIGMPRLNGHEVARRLRAEPWGRALHLIALTGWGQDEDRRRSHEAGFDAHLVKPVDPAELTRLLAELPRRTE